MVLTIKWGAVLKTKSDIAVLLNRLGVTNIQVGSAAPQKYFEQIIFNQSQTNSRWLELTKSQSYDII